MQKNSRLKRARAAKPRKVKSEGQPPLVSQPPVCAKVPHELETHGDVRAAPYHWLRDKANADVKAYLKEENAYADAVVDAGLKKKLFAEMKARWKETDFSIPTRDKGFYYYAREVEGEEHAMFLRRPLAGNETFVDDCVALVARDPDADVPGHPSEAIYLDVNEVSRREGVENIELGDFDFSPNERNFAVAVDLSAGEEIHTILVYVVLDGAADKAARSANDDVVVEGDDDDFEDCDDDDEDDDGAAGGEAGAAKKRHAQVRPIRRLCSREGHRICGEVMWASDTVFFYVTMDAAMRAYRVYRHDLAADADGGAADSLIFEEADETFSVGGLHRSDDDAFVLFQSSAKTSDEWLVAPRASPCEKADFRVFQPRQPDLEYSLSHHPALGVAGGGPHWLVWHTLGASTNLQLDVCPDAAGGTAAAHWRPLIAYDAAVKMECVDGYRDFLVLSVRRAGFERTLLLPTAAPRTAASPVLQYADLLDVTELLQAAPETAMEQPQLCTVSAFGAPEFDCRDIRGCVSHMVVPALEVQLTWAADGTWAVRLLKREPVKGGYDAAQYASELTWATAVQSTCPANDPRVSLSPTEPIRIPISLCYRKDLRRPGENPLLLYVYGSYGDSCDPEFDADRLSLLDRGFVFALAGVRGGGEMGRIWRNAGRLEHRVNAITDYIACAEHVIAERWCHAGRVVAMGESAGGTIVAAAMNVAPQLLRTVVARVPFVDVLTTMLDASLPLTVPEWEEWGNPASSAAVYHRLKAYSPVDNVPAGAVFPNLFVESGFSDPRVLYHEPATWVAVLREQWGLSEEAGRVAVHKCNLGAGHGGASGRYKHLHETATIYAFILDTAADDDGDGDDEAAADAE
jgi:oligopeptidase B